MTEIDKISHKLFVFIPRSMILFLDVSDWVFPINSKNTGLQFKV